MSEYDGWVKDRAEHLIREHVYTHFDRCEPPSAPHEYATYLDIAAALQEAIERGKAEQDKAVAAERERLLKELDEAQYALKSNLPINMRPVFVKMAEDAIARAYEQRIRAEAVEAKLARLENPDEALVEAVGRAVFVEWSWRRHRDEFQPKIQAAIKRLALTLTEGQESSDGA